MTTAAAKYNHIKEEIKQLRKSLETQSKNFFQEASAEIFEKHPELKSFSWTQYTPYFNDGDECVFGANSDYVTVAIKGDKNEGEDEDDDREISSWNLRKATKLTPKEAAAKDALELLAAFENEDFKTMFGDHVRVTVSRNGVSVTEYSHD
jgi:hypothetical protein